MKRIVTISREYGSGGGTIGHALAGKLGYEYYDRELILKTSRDSYMDVESIMKWDEKVAANFGFAQSLFDFYNKPISEKVYETQQKIIREIGEAGNCVIVGRNANSILKEFSDSLHVFIYAEPEWRIKYMQAKTPEVSEAKMGEQIREMDNAIKKYCAYHTNKAFDVADNYDICLNTSALGIQTCVDILYDLVTKE